MGMQSVQTQAEAKQKIADLQVELARIKEQKDWRPNYKADIAKVKTEIAELKAKMSSLPK